MPVALDLNTLSEPLREVFQSVLGERDEARLEHRRVEVENKLLKGIHPANPLEEAEAGEVCGCD